MRLPVPLAAFATVVLLAAVTPAQTRDPATADALFREARALMKRGDYVSACPKLADSQRLDPAAGTAINLGDCLEKVGKLADALQTYREALDMLQPGDKRIEPLKAQIAAIERRAPKLTITLAAGAPEGTTVSRDGVLLGVGGLRTALPVNVGDHEIVVSAPGHVDRRYIATLGVAESKALEVDVGEAIALSSPGARPFQTRSEPPRPRGESPSGAQGGTQRTLAWVLTGAGAVGVVIGAVELLRWRDADERVKDQCKVTSSGNFACSNLAEAEQDRKDAQRDALISNVSFAVGGAFLVGGVVLLLSTPEKQSAGVRVRAGVTSKALGLAAEGKW